MSQKTSRWPWKIRFLGFLCIVAIMLLMAEILIVSNKIPQENPSLTIVCNNGQLGNQMFTYATLIGVARYNNRKPLVPSCNFEELEEYFQISQDAINSSLFENLKKSVINVNNLTVPLEKSIFSVAGFYPVSYYYFEHVRNEILREFRFQTVVLDYADAVLRNVRQKTVSKDATFVAVHVRRGSIKRQLCGLHAIYEAGANFFLKAMNIFRKKYSNAVFVVTSDDPQWTQSNLNGSDVFYVGNKTLKPVFDLAVLSRSNHTIFAYGTFGFWAAYLSGGQTIYLADLKKSNPQMDKNLRDEHVYKPEWTGIEEGSPLICPTDV